MGKRVRERIHPSLLRATCWPGSCLSLLRKPQTIFPLQQQRLSGTLAGSRAEQHPHEQPSSACQRFGRHSNEVPPGNTQEKYPYLLRVRPGLAPGTPDAWHTEMLCRAGRPPRRDLTPRGASLLPGSPRTLPSWLWRGNGNPPTGVRARMYLFTLAHDGINHYRVLLSGCHVQCKRRDTKDLLFSQCVCLS